MITLYIPKKIQAIFHINPVILDAFHIQKC